MIHYLGEDEARYERAMRFLRDDALRASDWTQFNDSPLSEADKQAWATYRQALRDFPATWTLAETADFPDPPA